MSRPLNYSLFLPKAKKINIVVWIPISFLVSAIPGYVCMKLNNRFSVRKWLPKSISHARSHEKLILLIFHGF